MSDDDGFFPDCPIIDPHHHLFPSSKSTKPPAPIMQRTFGLAPNKNYLAADLEADIGRSVNVCATVHAEAKTGYDRTLPKHLQSIGETRFLLKQCNNNTRICRGIIIGVDLTACTEQEFISAIEFHQSVVGENTRVCGVRATLASYDNGDLYSVAEALAYRSMIHNARVLGERFNLPLDVWMYAPQLPDLYEFALECPQTKFVCDHVGTPLFPPGEMEEAWKRNMQKLSTLPNVYVKLGGMGMHCCFGKSVVLSGKRWLSDDICRNLLPYYQHVFDCFGSKRVMFESNFPMDRVSYSYESFWTAAKKMSVVLSRGGGNWEVRRRILFTNANELYQLNLPVPELNLYAFGESKL